jgi:hypothetical protein
MKANELRIGNWIYDPLNKTEFQIDVFLGSEYCTNKCEFESQEFDAKIEDCQPIPLTEDWLLKFGFKNENDYYTFENIMISDIHKGTDWSFDLFDDYLNEYSCLAIINYVHQLQNLYFALHGEELTLSE